MFMNTFFVLGAVALLSLLAFYWKGKISTSFMTTGVLVILFIFSFLTGR
jgi:hypothetical protein